jgi:hypothetical protein
MAYRDKVQALCDQRVIENPIREEDLSIALLTFYIPGDAAVCISATDMNRGGRLFFQDIIDGKSIPGLRPGTWDARRTTLELDDELKRRFAEYVSELWDDAGNGTRKLIDAVYKGYYLVITEKENFYGRY